MSQILLLEDDEQLGQALLRQLKQSGFDVSWCQTLQQYRDVKASFDLAVIDLNLPDGNGFEAVEQLSIPVIVMTALNTPENRLKALELGGYEFIPKPFLYKELLMKMERLLSGTKQKMMIAGCEVDFSSRSIRTQNKETLFLTDREYLTLKTLADASPSPVTRDQILDAMGTGEESASHRTIDNTIVKLRQYVGDEAHQFIKSIRGVGYQLLGDNHES